MTLRLNDLGGIFKRLFSPANVELLAPFANPLEAQMLRLVSGYAYRIPAKSIALVVGGTAQRTPFLQIAVAMPEELQPKLSLIAEGKATAEDLTALVVGDDSSHFSITDVVVRQGKQGPYYTLDEKPLSISAKGNLLLIALSAEDMDASKEALEKADKRLSFKRRFASPNYCVFHLDMPTVLKAAEEDGKKDKSADTLLRLFKAPLKFEIAFDAKPDNFLMSCAVNVLEAFTATERFEKLKPLKGGGLFLSGGGKPYLGLSFLCDFHPEDLEFSPESLVAWNSLLGKLEREGIPADDVDNLLKGSFSLVAGADATIFGQPMPGGYLTFTGQKGAAGHILQKLLENEKFATSVPLSPLKAEGWEMLFEVDPALLPLPLLVGVKGETLFVGVVDPNGINTKPEFSPQAAEFVGQDSFAATFLDTSVLWEHLKRVLLDKKSFLRSELEAYYPFAADILNGELPLGLIKVWTPSLETSFLEIQLADVPAEKNVFPRLVNALKTVFSGSGANGKGGNAEGEDTSLTPFDNDSSQPLTLLIVAKMAIEETLAEDPETKLDSFREDFSDFAVILETENGDIYVGTQVSGEEKSALLKQVERFELLGSAGLTIAPDGTPYDGQEAVWVKIQKQ